jgi:hypothetical protein
MNKVITCFAITAMIVCAHKLYAQDNFKRTPKTKFEIDGSVALSTNGKLFYFNMGGPGVSFTLQKHQFSVNMFPSIGISRITKPSGDRPLHAVTAVGIALQYYHNRFVFTMPFYYRASNNTWVGTIGVGYKILKI